jgi:hypothetical protein
MEWTIQDLGAAGEFLGAITVLATLVYLAYQTRRIGKIAETEFHRDSVSLAGPVMEWIAKDESLAKVLREGLIDLPALNDVERLRFSALMTSFVLSFKAAMESHDRGVMDRPTYEAWELHVAVHLNMPGGRTWWEHGQLMFIPLVRERLTAATKMAPRMDDFQPEIWGAA